MLDKVLSSIKDSEDYLKAIRTFQDQGPMTETEVNSLLEIYARYVPGAEDPEYAKACLAVDMLSGRTEEDRACFAPLELGEKTLDALFIVKGLFHRDSVADKEETREILEMVQDGDLKLWARVLLARTALNALAWSKELADIRAEVTALAEFLTDCGGETLDRYAELAGEVRWKCKM